MRLNGWEWIIILAIVLVLFGAPKLPGLAKSLGESIRIFRKEMKTEAKAKDSDSKDDESKDASTDKK